MGTVKFIYDSETGELLEFRGAVGAGETEGSCAPSALVWGIDVDKYKVIDGVITPLTTVDAGEVVIDRDKERAIQNILTARYARETADIDYNGVLIKQDRESRALMANAFDVIRRGVVTSIEWTCKNGYLTLTENNIADIELLGLQQIQSAFDWAKAEIEKLGV